MQAKERAKKSTARIKARMKPTETRERGPATLYLDSKLLKAFKGACEGMGSSASQMIEEFMREFLQK